LSRSAVEELPEGWLTPAGFVDYRDARVLPSHDEHYHICITDPPAVVFRRDIKSTTFSYMRCFYVPPMGM
jgi:hypothetical protein